MSDQDPTHIPLHRRLRDARRSQGMTQSELAGRIGCKQSAISMLESGRSEALARPAVEKMAEILGVELDSEESCGASVTPTAGAHGICPQSECPSNVPFAVHGDLLLWPRPQPVPGGRHCAYCGEVLERTCRQCGAPVRRGACCPSCGTPWVAPPVDYEGTAEQWARTRRQRIAEWRSLLDG